MPQRRFETGELQFGPQGRGGGLCESRSSVTPGPTRGRGCKACPRSCTVRQITWECTGAGWGDAAGATLMENVCRHRNQRTVWRAGWKKRLISVVSCAQRDTTVTGRRVPFVFVASAKCRSQISLSSKLPAER